MPLAKLVRVFAGAAAHRRRRVLLGVGAQLRRHDPGDIDVQRIGQAQAEAARELAARYGGDPASADYRHYGRLSGSTNRKPERALGDGRQPFVLLRESSGRVAEGAEELLDRAAERVRVRERLTAEVRAEEARRQARAGGPQDPNRSDDFARPFSPPEGGR